MRRSRPAPERTSRGWRAVDLGTRKFWRAAGRPVDLGGEHAWLRAPMSVGGPVTDEWLDAEAVHHGGTVARNRMGAGLLGDLSELSGPGFSADRVHNGIRAFYEHTSQWRLEVWVGWSPVFWPGVSWSAGGSGSG
ncbi:MAG: hypothetical protein ACRCYQ_17305 [Nocardioides sp.]